MKRHSSTWWWMEFDDNASDLTLTLLACRFHDNLSDQWFERMAGFMRTLTIPRQELAAGIPLEPLLVLFQLVDSLSEARRKLKEKSIKINKKIISPGKTLTLGDLVHDKWILFGAGKSSRAMLMAIEEDFDTAVM